MFVAILCGIIVFNLLVALATIAVVKYKLIPQSAASFSSTHQQTANGALKENMILVGMVLFVACLWLLLFDRQTAIYTTLVCAFEAAIFIYKSTQGIVIERPIAS